MIVVEYVIVFMFCVHSISCISANFRDVWNGCCCCVCKVQMTSARNQCNPTPTWRSLLNSRALNFFFTLYFLFILVHDYDYRRDSWNWKQYLVPRFASEFGLQSWCSLESLATVSVPVVDWDIDSAFVDHRQHHGNGKEQTTSSWPVN